MLAGCLGIVMWPYHDMLQLTFCQLITVMTSKLEGNCRCHASKKLPGREGGEEGGRGGFRGRSLKNGSFIIKGEVTLTYTKMLELYYIHHKLRFNGLMLC